MVVGIVIGVIVALLFALMMVIDRRDRKGTGKTRGAGAIGSSAAYDRRQRSGSLRRVGKSDKPR